MYILRARVIEGSIPMPSSPHMIHSDLKEDNFEIIAAYTRENFKTLFEIGKNAWDEGTLSKFEILAWDGGANNHDGDRYLWSYRPDMWNFEHMPEEILNHFDDFEPQAKPVYVEHIYNRFWKTLPHAFSLASYLDMSGLNKKFPLDEQIHSAQSKQMLEKNKGRQPDLPER